MDKINDRINEIFEIKQEDIYPPIPKKNLLIEISNSCNYKCIFCANRKMTRKRGKINPALLEKILNEAYDLGVKEVGFYTTGEPLLNTELNNYIKLAKKIGYSYIYITTNGYLADLEKIKQLISSGLNSIKFSINAINTNDYKFIHGIDGYDKVMFNLKKLYNYRNEQNINLKIYVSYVATRYTSYTNEEINNNFKNYCDDVVIVNVRNQSGIVPEIDIMLSCIEDIDKRIQASRVLPCHYTFNAIVVTYEGYLTACCTDFQNYLAYADLNKTTIKEAWHNEKITLLRKKQLTYNLRNTLCDNCINTVTTLPQPLDSNLCTKMNNCVFLDENYVKEQIEKYMKN